MTEARIRCCVPECRRSFKLRDDPDANHGHDEIMCGRCYRTVEPRLIARHKSIHRRWRKAQRLSFRKEIGRKATLAAQIGRLDRLFRDACARSWSLIKKDAMMKSALQVEGTAGHLAARRKRTAA